MARCRLVKLWEPIMLICWNIGTRGVGRNVMPKIVEFEALSQFSVPWGAPYKWNGTERCFREFFIPRQWSCAMRKSSLVRGAKWLSFVCLLQNTHSNESLCPSTLCSSEEIVHARRVCFRYFINRGLNAWVTGKEAMILKQWMDPRSSYAGFATCTVAAFGTPTI
jgi:hypothetical protein